MCVFVCVCVRVFECVCVCVCLCVCVCVCVCMCNILLVVFYATPHYLRRHRTPIIPSPSLYLIYADSKISLAIHQQLPITIPMSLVLPPHVRPVFLPNIWPRQGAISAIIAPSFSSGCCQMRAPFPRGPRRSRLLDLTIASYILAHTKPHVSEYSRFSLYLSSASNLFCADKTSAPGIPCAEYTIGVKVLLHSRQA